MTGDLLLVAAVLVTGLLAGNELGVAAVVHPSLRRLPDPVHLRAVQAVGRASAAVMPWWWAGALALNVAALCALPFGTPRWGLAAGGAGAVLAALVFGLAGPVRVNNRVIGWDPNAPPPGRRDDRRRWDRLHAVRTAVLGLGWVLQVASLAAGGHD